jgi:uncharacterized protein YjdB
MRALRSGLWPSFARLLVIVVPVALAGVFSACEGDNSMAPAPSLNTGNGPSGKNATVRVAPMQDTLNALHDGLQLTANVPVTWTSLTPGISSVDASGHVIALSPGLALIEALANRKGDTAQVLVRQIVASVQVSPDSITVVAGLTGSFTAAVADSNGYAIANPVVTWASDATAVATVANGVVTGGDSGATTIRATAGGVTGTARVGVIPPAMPYP